MSAAHNNARDKSRARLPAALWVTVETETRIAIHSGRRTIAYMQMAAGDAASDADLAAAICALPALLHALKRCVREGDLPLGVDSDARAALAEAGEAP